MSSLQEQKSFTEKSSKALQDKEKELQKALKDAKVLLLLYLCVNDTVHIYTASHAAAIFVAEDMCHDCCLEHLVIV